MLPPVEDYCSTGKKSPLLVLWVTPGCSHLFLEASPAVLRWNQPPPSLSCNHLLACLTCQPGSPSWAGFCTWSGTEWGQQTDQGSEEKRLLIEHLLYTMHRAGCTSDFLRLSPEVCKEGILVPILQMKKPRLREKETHSEIHSKCVNGSGA